MTNALLRLQGLASLAGDLYVSAFPLADQGILPSTLPPRLRWFADGARIRGAAPRHGDLLGAKVDSIGGRSATELIGRLAQLIPGSAGRTRSNLLLGYLLAPHVPRDLGAQVTGDTVSFALVREDGARVAVHLRATGSSLMEAAESNTLTGWRVPPGWSSLLDGIASAAARRRVDPRMAWFERLPGDAALLIVANQPAADTGSTLLRFQSALLAEMAERRFRRIVVDLRGNEGGAFVLTNPLAGILASQAYRDDSPLIGVLIGTEVVSAGAALATQLEIQTEALFFGSATGSSPNYFATYRARPLRQSGFYVRVSTRQYVMSLPSDDCDRIAPDVEVRETIEDVRGERDAVLERTLREPIERWAPVRVPRLERWRRKGQRPSGT